MKKFEFYILCGKYGKKCVAKMKKGFYIENGFAIYKSESEKQYIVTDIDTGRCVWWINTRTYKLAIKEFNLYIKNCDVFERRNIDIYKKYKIEFNKAVQDAKNKIDELIKGEEE